MIVARNSKDTKALTKDYRHAQRRWSPSPRRRSRSTGRPSGSRPSAGQRVFVLWRSYGNRSAERAPDRSIAHELVHAALVKRSGGRVPAWLSEGIAMYASGDKRMRRRRRAAQRRRSCATRPSRTASRTRSRSTKLAKPTSLDRMSPIPLTFAYSYASAAAFAIAEKYGGAKALLRLYSAFNSEKIKGTPGRKLTDKVVRKTLKTSLSSLEDDVDAYARARSLENPRSDLRVSAPAQPVAQRPSLLGRDARAARSRDDPPPSGAPRRGAGAGGGGRARRALVAGRSRRRSSRTRSQGRRVERLVAARQVPRLGALRRRLPADAPADDRARCCSTRTRRRGHARVRFALGDHELVFDDPRRFGTGELALGEDALDAFFAERLGVEPLDGRPQRRGPPRARAGRRAPMKAFLLDQKRVAGVGNIYADEALFRARVHPLRPSKLTRGQCAALATRSRRRSRRDRGKAATIDDFRDPDGVSGRFQDEFLVHLREGEECPNCGRRS